MKKNSTELVFIVDRSGSMAGLESDTVGGINATLAQNRTLEGECTVSIVFFDNTAEVAVDRVDIKELADLDEGDYQVGGCTALLDCLGNSIRHIKQVQGYMPQEYKAEKVVFVITTDGQENASSKYTYADVKRLVEQQSEQGWEFVFLGANMDAITEAGRIGIRSNRAATYLADEEGSAVMFDGVAMLTRELRCAKSSASVGAGWKEEIDADTKRRGK